MGSPMAQSVWNLVGELRKRFGETDLSFGGGLKEGETTVSAPDGTYIVHVDGTITRPGNSRLGGVYVVTVGPDISDMPVRWCFVKEEDADRFIAEVEPNGVSSWEPISHEWDDPNLKEYLRMVNADA